MTTYTNHYVHRFQNNDQYSNLINILSQGCDCTNSECCPLIHYFVPFSPVDISRLIERTRWHPITSNKCSMKDMYSDHVIQESCRTSWVARVLHGRTLSYCREHRLSFTGMAGERVGAVQCSFHKHKRWTRVVTYDTSHNGACVLWVNRLWNDHYLHQSRTCSHHWTQFDPLDDFFATPLVTCITAFDQRH